MSVTVDDCFAASGSPNFDYLAAGASKRGFVTQQDQNNNPNFVIGALLAGQTYGVLAHAGPADGTFISALENSYSTRAGVFGASFHFTGVAGTSDGLQPGVYGQSGDARGIPPGIQAGVFGVSRLAPGVRGWSIENNGVAGQSTTDIGVWGASARAHGVLGQTGGFPYGGNYTDPNNPTRGDRSGPAGVLGTATETFGVAGTSAKSSGVLGQSGAPPAFEPSLNYIGGVVGTSRDAAGVVAVSQNRFGVIATSQKSAGVYAASQNAAGVSAVSAKNFGVLAIAGAEGPKLPPRFATSLAAVRGGSRDHVGVIGASQEETGVVGYAVKGSGVVGWTDNPAAFAGFFVGNVSVSGSLTASVKNAVVAFPDGSRRLLHCMESPEHWFEDFGSGKLTRGRATVKLDRDFAKVVKLTDYRVFLTPEGDCRGLYVRRGRGASFQVRELQGGASGVRFSYRIVGRRKDVKGHKRFAKIDSSRPMPFAKARSSRGRIAAPSSTSMRALRALLKKHARRRTKKQVRGRKPTKKPA